MYAAYFALINNAPSSASAADDITAFMICAMFKIDPLGDGISSLFDRENSPPVLLLASGMLL